MSSITFRISTTETNYCFKPLTCPTEKGHLVVWGHGVDPVNTSVWVTSFSPGLRPVKRVLVELNERDNIIYFEPYSTDKYALCIEHSKGYTVYLLNKGGDIVNKRTTITDDVLVKYCQASNSTDSLLFTYNYSKSTFTVNIVDPSDTVKTIVNYADIWSIPQVFVDDADNYFAAWIDKSDVLQVVSNNIYDSNKAQIVSLKQYDVDYLMGARVNKDWIALGGYFTPTNTLRVDYCSVVNNNNDIKIISRYWKSEEYKGFTFTMESLRNGFMLLGDSPDNTVVCGQRFTHLGSWLYPLMNLVDEELPSWSASLAQGSKNTLLVYTKDFSNHSEIWGKWMNITDVPELKNLTLDDIN